METCFSRPLVQDGLTHVHRLVSWEVLRSLGFSWDDLCRLARRFRIVWLSRDVFVYSCDEHEDDVSQTLHNRGGYACLFRLSVGKEKDGTNPHPSDTVCVCSVTPEEEPAREYQELFQLVGRKHAAELSVGGSGDDRFEVDGEGGGDDDDDPYPRYRLPISPETLGCLLDDSIDRNWLIFESVSFTEQQCQQLSESRGMIAVHACSFADEGRRICEAVERPQGLTAISIRYNTRIDARSLSNAVCNTSTLRFISASSVPGFFPQCLPGLKQNRCIQHLSVCPDSAARFTEKEWSDLFEAIQNHETLQYFKFRDKDASNLECTDSARAARTQVILEALRNDNRCLDEIILEPANLVDRQIFDEQIQPHLTANRYRRRIQTLAEDPGGCNRLQLFSRALTQTEVNRNPSAMFMLLSGFHDLLSEFYPTREMRDEEPADIPNNSSTKRPSLASNNDVRTKRCKTK